MVALNTPLLLILASALLALAGDVHRRDGGSYVIDLTARENFIKSYCPQDVREARDCM